MRRGFTLIELLVASLLLGILVTTLTMLFNSSSIAWRTGTAGVAKLQTVRRALGETHEIRDEVLPGLGDTSDSPSSSGRTIQYRTVSILNDEGSQVEVKTDTGRAYEQIVWDEAPNFSFSDAKNGGSKSVSGGSMVGSGLFTVGVRSLGPDGKEGTEDDITTWPDEVF